MKVTPVINDELDNLKVLATLLGYKISEDDVFGDKYISFLNHEASYYSIVIYHSDVIQLLQNDINDDSGYDDVKIPNGLTPTKYLQQLIS